MTRLTPHTCLQLLVLGALLAILSWTWQTGRSTEARMVGLVVAVEETSARLTVVNTVLRECAVQSTIPAPPDSVGVVFVCSREGIREVLDIMQELH